MPPVLCIVGPTAAGKSSLALELAGPLAGEIVNADALQVYRGFDVGTAKPSRAERRRVAHHLVDILDPHETFSAGEFARRARAAIRDIRGRGRLPMLVGGSGLYLRALIEGISPIPAVDPALRRTLRARLDAEGAEPLRAELRRLDPETAERLAPADSQRLLRALEVALGTGRPQSSWIAERPAAGGLEAIWIGLTVPRALLYDRIAIRAERMLADGWVDEVRRLLAAGLDRSLPAFQAIGYRELARHLDGQLGLEEATDRIVTATRQYAKRQMTWFRRQGGIEWFAAAETSPATVLEQLARLGLAGAGTVRPGMGI
jgi:tRNA dimethylallyltransferase